MGLPQFIAGCSLREPTARYDAATSETAPHGVQPQTIIDPGGGGGTPGGKIDLCPLIWELCDLCLTLCKFVPFYGDCFLLCDRACMACRY